MKILNFSLKKYFEWKDNVMKDNVTIDYYIFIIILLQLQINFLITVKTNDKHLNNRYGWLLQSSVKLI